MKRVDTRLWAFCILGLAAVVFCCGCSRQKEPSEPASDEPVQQEETASYPQEIGCQNGENNIYGVLYRPATEDKVPLMICSHGFANTYESLSFLGEDLVDYGVAVYCFDFCGGSEESKSDGSMLDMSLMTNVSDLNAVLDMVNGWDFIDPSRIVLLGFSQGGAASAIVASQRKDEVAGLILLAPAFNIPDIARDRYQWYENEAMVPDLFEHMEYTVGRRYFEDVLQYDIYQEIKEFQNPVLLFQGAQDESVPVWYAEYAARVYNDVKYVKFPNAGHNLMATNMGDMMDDIWCFLERLGFWN